MSGSRERLFRLVLIVLGVMALAFSEVAWADTYTYDVYGRLTGVTYSNGSTVTYSYDAAGNRITVSQTP